MNIARCTTSDAIAVLFICILCGVLTVRPAQVEITEGQQMCAICSDVGNGIHFGVITCEGCKVRSLELLPFEAELTAIM